MNDLDFSIISPIDGSILHGGRYATVSEIDVKLSKAEQAFKTWGKLPLVERTKAVSAFVDALETLRTSLSEQVMWTVGRPRQQADEMGRVISVMKEMVSVSYAELEDKPQLSDDQIDRFVRRDPRGVSLAICAWNYPVAMAGGMVVASMLAGNVVILKHAPQTASIANLFEQAYEISGAPPGAFQVVHMDHSSAEQVIASGRINYVQFIGSESGGRAVHRAAALNLVPIGLELGGKDPAYVREDAEIERTVAELVDGCFGNSGQSCCSVERLYVHDAIYDEFVECFTSVMRSKVFGDPRNNPDIGPLVSHAAAARIHQSIEHAVSKGATRVDHSSSSPSAPKNAYLAPVVLLNVNHDMGIMIDELFGPVAPIMRVSDDTSAVKLMNDSRYGLTASVWSRDHEVALSIATQVSAGTTYVNRCDHADIYLPWTGHKASGMGSSYGPSPFNDLTTVRGIHVRKHF